MVEEEVYTVMVRNIPCSCKRQEVLDAIEEVGFKDRYEFFYLPTRYSKYLGYAFIGFPDPRTTKEFTEAMTGYRFRSRSSQKVISVVPAHIQGLGNNMRHFQDLYVMRTRHVPTFNHSDASCADTAETSYRHNEF
jgi:RNA recognition motif-containing protein